MKKLVFALLILSAFKITSINSFQDPARTSDNKKVNPSKNLDGSGGRYKKDHKHANGKHFATNKKHIKTAKPGNEKGKEHQTSKAKGTETGG